MAKTYEHTHDGEMGTIVKADEQSKTLIEHKYQDVENILKHNKAQRNEFGKGYNRDRSMRAIAEIPMIVAYQWLQEDGFMFTSLEGEEQHKYLQRKLNNPQWAYLRTSEGTF